MKSIKLLALLLAIGCCSCSKSAPTESSSKDYLENVDPIKEASIRTQLAVVQKLIEDGSDSACGTALKIVEAASSSADNEALRGMGGLSADSKRRLERFKSYCSERALDK